MVNGHREFQVLLADEVTHLIFLLAGINANQNQAGLLVFKIEPVESCHLLFAGAAPGREEIQDNHFLTDMIGKLEPSAIQNGKIEIGSNLSP